MTNENRLMTQNCRRQIILLTAVAFGSIDTFELGRFSLRKVNAWLGSYDAPYMDMCIIL